MYERVLGSNVSQLVTLAVELAPQDVLQFAESLTGNGRDEHHGKVVGQRIAQHVYQLGIQQVALGNGQHAMLI